MFRTDSLQTIEFAHETERNLLDAILLDGHSRRAVVVKD